MYVTLIPETVGSQWCEHGKQEIGGDENKVRAAHQCDIVHGVQLLNLKYSRIKKEIETVHERLSTNIKTRCEEMLAEVEKKHNVWEEEVTKTALL